MSGKIGKNSKSIKDANKRLITKLICTEDNISRIKLSNMTSLSKMTVTNLIAELMNDGIIVESQALESTTSGPKPINLTVSDKAPIALGLAIRRGRIGVVASTLDFRILYQKYLNYSADSPMEAIYWLCYSLLDEAIACVPATIAGIGITSPGPIDKKSGMILNPPNLFSSQNIPIVKLLSERYKVPVFLDKDTTASCIAEKLWGNGKLHNNFAYVSFASGIGMSLISDGEIYQPNSSLAGEIGHASIKFDGDLCQCGNRGCLELYCSATLITKDINKRLQNDWSFSECMQHADLPEVSEILKERLYYLNVSLINMVNEMNPSCIILGDRATEFPDYCLDYIAAELNSKLFAGEYAKCEVARSRFGRDSSLFGSCAILAKNMFF